MERLSATDLQTVLDVARELGAVRDVEDLRASVLPQLQRLVACDLASFNEIAPSTGQAIVTAIDPADSMFDGGEEIFGAFAHQNPLIAAAQGPDDCGVRKFSDFISRRRLHGLDIYDLLYEPIEVEHQIAFTLPAPATRVVGFALSRSRRDFSERDRRVLQAVRPFVVQAYERAATQAHVAVTLDALERASGSTASAVMILDDDGRIEFATDLAGRWIGGLAHADGCERLPEPLESWRAAQRLRARDGLPGGERLELRTLDATITAQFIPGATNRPDLLLLQRHGPLRTDALRTLGLTDREIEVLLLLANGLSNSRIALELALSERTIAKHLEHIYGKLNVGNRTAAVAQALEVSARVYPE